MTFPSFPCNTSLDITYTCKLKSTPALCCLSDFFSHESTGCVNVCKPIFSGTEIGYNFFYLNGIVYMCFVI